MKQTALHRFVNGVGLVPNNCNARTQYDASLAPNITISSRPVTLHSQSASHCIENNIIDSQSFIINLMKKYLSENLVNKEEGTAASAPHISLSLNDISQIKPGSDFSTRYILGPIIGGGGDGTVHLLISKSSPCKPMRQMVCKKISIHSHSDYHLFQKLSASLQELHLVKQTKIITLHGLYYDAFNNSIYKIYDRFDADLSQIIYKLNTHKLGLTEPQTRRLMRSLCLKIDVLHRNGYIHGDIKPSNILFGSNQWHLIDFDRVKFCRNGTQIFSKFCGTFGFTAPELIHHGGPVLNIIDHSIDIWAVGLMIIWCLNGGHLGLLEVETTARDAYNSAVKEANMESMSRIFNEYYNSIFNTRNITTPRYTEEIQRLYESNKISLCLYDLLKKILVRHPRKRLNAMEVLNHDWFQSVDGCDPSNDDDMIWIEEVGEERNFYRTLIDVNTEHIAIHTQKTKALYDLNTQCLQMEDAYDELLNGSTSYVEELNTNIVQNNHEETVAFDGFGDIDLFGNKYGSNTAVSCAATENEVEDAVFVSFSSFLNEEVVECRSPYNESTESMVESEVILHLLNGSRSYDPEKEEHHQLHAKKETMDEMVNGDYAHADDGLWCGCDINWILDNHVFDEMEGHGLDEEEGHEY